MSQESIATKLDRLLPEERREMEALIAKRGKSYALANWDRLEAEIEFAVHSFETKPF